MQLDLKRKPTGKCGASLSYLKGREENKGGLRQWSSLAFAFAVTGGGAPEVSCAMM